MKFIELTGRVLKEVVHPDEMDAEQLEAAGVFDDAVVRINEQGDIEVRRTNSWDIIGGLLGNFEERLKQQTGMDWV